MNSDGLSLMHLWCTSGGACYCYTVRNLNVQNELNVHWKTPQEAIATFTLGLFVLEGDCSMVVCDIYLWASAMNLDD